MIRVVSVFDDQVTIEEVGLDEVQAAPDRVLWQWVDVAGGDREEIVGVGHRFALDAVSVEEVAEPTVLPKVAELAEHLFLISHSPGLSEGRIATLELDAFAGPATLVTFHRQPVPGVEAAMEHLAAGRGTGSPGDALVTILDTGAERSLHLVDALDNQIAELEDLAIGGHPEVVARIQDLRRDAVVLRRALAPERDMVRELSRSERHLDPEARRRLDGVYYDYLRIVESLDGARALLGAVLETYRSSIAERTNEVVKVLTVFSVVLLPLSLIAGIYGMNFASMPLLDLTWGFYAVLGAMIVIGVGLWWYFARRGFVVGPKVPRVDRAVGRGLAQFIDITTQPVREVGKRIAGSDS